MNKPQTALTKSRSSSQKDVSEIIHLLCQQLKVHIGQETSHYYQCGKIIDDMMPKFEVASMSAHGEPASKTNIPKNRARYGDGLYEAIACELGGTARSWRNRRYFYLAAKEFTIVDNLSQDHYLYLHHYLGKMTPQNGLREKLGTLLRLASLEHWTANTFKAKVDNATGISFAPIPIGGDLVVRDFSKTLNNAVDAVTVAITEIRNIKNRHTSMVDQLRDKAYELANLLHLITTNDEEAGRNLDKILAGANKMDSARWVGGKRAMQNKILFDLREYFKTNSIKTACDLFGGRAHVARALKWEGYKVTVNDKYLMPHLWQWLVIENDAPVIDDNDLTKLMADIKIDSRFKWVKRLEVPHRPGVKFPVLTPDNANTVMRFLTNLQKLSAKKQKAALALLSTAIYEKLPYGQEDHGKPSACRYNIANELRQRLDYANSYAFAGKNRCHATNDDAVEHLKHNKYDLLYLDPPYAVGKDYIYSNTSPESMAQCRFVDFKEMKSPYAGNKDAAIKALQDLFAAADKSAPLWIMSYNESPKTLLTRIDLGRLITPYRAVLFVEVPHRMSSGQAKGSGMKTLANEYLVFCCPYMIKNHPAVISKLRQPLSKTTNSKGLWLTPGSFVDMLEVPQQGNDDINIAAWKTPEGGIVVEIIDSLGTDCSKILEKITNNKELMKKLWQQVYASEIQEKMKDPVFMEIIRELQAKRQNLQ